MSEGKSTQLSLKGDANTSGCYHSEADHTTCRYFEPPIMDDAMSLREIIARPTNIGAQPSALADQNVLWSGHWPVHALGYSSTTHTRVNHVKGGINPEATDRGPSFISWLPSSTLCKVRPIMDVIYHHFLPAPRLGNGERVAILEVCNTIRVYEAVLRGVLATRHQAAWSLVEATARELKHVRLALMVQDDKTYKTTRQRDHTLDAQKKQKKTTSSIRVNPSPQVLY